MERQWNRLSELSITKVFSTRTPGLPASQAVTASPSSSRSFAFVAEKTFTTLTLSALTDASPVPDACASSTLLCTIDQCHRNLRSALERSAHQRSDPTTIALNAAP